MLYREIIALCSQIHTKHINTLCGQNLLLLNVAVHILTTGNQMVNKSSICVCVVNWTLFLFLKQYRIIKYCSLD